MDGAHRQGRRCYTRAMSSPPVGCLTATNMPPFKGLELVQGQVVPHQPVAARGVDFTAKRVAVIGTGATAVQAIPEIAQQAKHLTVFQRTPTFCVPARNGKVDPEVTKARKADYDGVRRQHPQLVLRLRAELHPEVGARDHARGARARVRPDVGPGRLRSSGSANYQDMFFDKEANDVIADYLKRKIRSTVNDPVVAEKLIPRPTPTALSASRWTPTTTRPSTSATCYWSTPARRPDRGDHAERHPCRRQGVRVRHHRPRHRL